MCFTLCGISANKTSNFRIRPTVTRWWNERKKKRQGKNYEIQLIVSVHTRNSSLFSFVRFFLSFSEKLERTEKKSITSLDQNVLFSWISNAPTGFGETISWCNQMCLPNQKFISYNACEWNGGVSTQTNWQSEHEEYGWKHNLLSFDRLSFFAPYRAFGNRLFSFTQLVFHMSPWLVLLMPVAIVCVCRLNSIFQSWFAYIETHKTNSLGHTGTHIMAIWHVDWCLFFPGFLDMSFFQFHYFLAIFAILQCDGDSNWIFLRCRTFFNNSFRTKRAL